jgi:hypothetical protein
MVYSLDCIVGLENNITIDEKAADAHRVKRLIESMWDGLGRFGADRLVVELNGAAISVSGTVRSLREKQMVLGAAACANGALKVEDRIYINPD